MAGRVARPGVVRRRDSINLDQSGDRIHETYNLWVESLEDSIRHEAAAETGAVSSPPTGE